MFPDSSPVDATVHVWSLSTDSQNHRVSVETALKKEQLNSTLFVIVVDLAKPWGVLTCLEKWTSRLDKVVDSLLLELPDESNEMKKKHFEYVQERYGGMNYQMSHDSEAILPELPEGMLAVNMGIPLIVVGCNSECLYKPHAPISSQYKSNWMQVQLRKFCFQRGASLIFVPNEDTVADTVTDSSNMISSGLLLQQYLLHRLYPSSFRYLNDDFDYDPTRPDQSLMITSGQDSKHQIDSLVIGDLNPLEPNSETYFPIPHSSSQSNKVSNNMDEDETEGVWLEKVKNSLSESAAKRSVLSPIPKKKKATLGTNVTEAAVEVSEVSTNESSSTKSSSSKENVVKKKTVGKRVSPPTTKPVPPPPPTGRVSRTSTRTKATVKDKKEKVEDVEDFFATLANDS